MTRLAILATAATLAFAPQAQALTIMLNFPLLTFPTADTCDSGPKAAPDSADQGK